MKIKWEMGRQETGYQKLKIFESKFFKFDIYILKFVTGSYVSKHTDKVEGYKHYRLNINLDSRHLGGAPTVYGKCIIENNFFYLFRPDLYVHEVSEVIKGTRYILSIGWLR